MNTRNILSDEAAVNINFGNQIMLETPIHFNNKDLIATFGNPERSISPQNDSTRGLLLHKVSLFKKKPITKCESQVCDFKRKISVNDGQYPLKR